MWLNGNSGIILLVRQYKKHEDGRSTKKKGKVQCNNAYEKNRSNLGDGSELGKFA